MGKQIFFLLQDLVRMRRSPVAGFLRRHRGQLPGNIFFFHFFHTIFGESFFDLFFFSSGVPFVPIRRPSQLLPLPCGDALRPEIPHLQLAIIFFFVPFVGDLNEFCFFFRWDKVDCIQAPRFYSVNEHLYD